ncbi:hypothetical protein A4A58_13680 [Tardiphaga robiniae]|uniref:Uncharacterized protein n=1 Tax=Tardiphaga robiniae TaxID=943830 RepID=A0A163XV79_9BRAD|nr:hypothetical protein A4A58_13680 [Tardiphaga robiniae]
MSIQFNVQGKGSETFLYNLGVLLVWRFGRASDEEALKMVVTYLTINEPERRREIFELAEKYAKKTCAPPISQDNLDKK